MKRGTIVALAIGAVAIVGLGTLSGTVLAHDPERGGMGMGGGMMGMGGDHMGMGGMMGGHRMRMFEMLDADGDGAIGADEARTAMVGQMQAFDADGDGALSLEEFAAMHAAHTRPMMVDRFQFHDEDGDGKITEDEMTAPFQRMMRWMDHNGDGKVSPDDMREHMGGRGMGRGMHRE